MSNPTQSKEIALYFLGKKKIPITKANMVKNVTIAKSILDLGYSYETIIATIDLYLDKMFSLGFIKCVIQEVDDNIKAKLKKEEIKNALERINSETPLYKQECDVDESNRNKTKLERRTDKQWLRKKDTEHLFKRP